MNRDEPLRKVKHWLSVLQVHNIVRLFLALQADLRVGPLLKLYAWCGLVYIFSPLDVMPELFTGIGLLDDIIVSLIIMQSFLELAPRYVLNEHCARLGMRPEQIFISVPQTIREARSLYTFVREFKASFDATGRAAADADGAAAVSAEQPVGERAEAARAGSRYSAFRDQEPEE